MWLQLKSGPEDSRSGWLSMNLGALVAVAVFVVVVFDVVAVVLLVSLLVVVPVVELQTKVREDFTIRECLLVL